MLRIMRARSLTVKIITAGRSKVSSGYQYRPVWLRNSARGGGKMWIREILRGNIDISMDGLDLVLMEERYQG